MTKIDFHVVIRNSNRGNSYVNYTRLCLKIWLNYDDEDQEKKNRREKSYETWLGVTGSKQLKLISNLFPNREKHSDL